jgi:hypothetical protein
MNFLYKKVWNCIESSKNQAFFKGIWQTWPVNIASSIYRVYQGLWKSISNFDGKLESFTNWAWPSKYVENNMNFWYIKTFWNCFESSLTICTVNIASSICNKLFGIRVMIHKVGLFFKTLFFLSLDYIHIT